MLIHAFYRLCNKGFRFKVRKHIHNCRHDSFTVCGFDGIAADLKYGNPRNAVVRILDFSGIRSNRMSVCKNSNRSCTAHAGHRFAQRIVGSKLYECRKRFYNVVSEFSGKCIAGAVRACLWCGFWAGGKNTGVAAEAIGIGRHIKWTVFFFNGHNRLFGKHGHTALFDFIPQCGLQRSRRFRMGIDISVSVLVVNACIFKKFKGILYRKGI